MNESAPDQDEQQKIDAIWAMLAAIDTATTTEEGEGT